MRITAQPLKLKSPRGDIRRRDDMGVTLIECLVYLSLLFVILGLAFSTYERTHVTSQQLRNNAEEIGASLQAGERWRTDIRSATVEPEIENEMIHIRSAGTQVSYAFSDGAVLRRGGFSGEWRRVLTGVKNSRMLKDVGATVTSWRWELELKTKEKSPKVKPLFTFQAVPAATSK